MIRDKFVFHNGYEIPSLGFGTWRSQDGETAINAVKCAIGCGYTHIDTAAAYRNEKSVGIGIKESGVAREKLFITSKLNNPHRGYETTLAAFEQTMSDLQLDYLDLYLIHWPAAPHRFENWKEINAETWRAFEELYEAGRIKSIGVSNFLPHHLEALLETAKIMPMINQIEFHPGYMQPEAVQFCRERGIVVEAWSPIGSGRLLDHELLLKMAAKYNKSVAQICIRWCMQHDTLPLAKSVTPSRIAENIQIYDFEISDEDMKLIDEMEFAGFSGLHPDRNKF